MIKNILAIATVIALSACSSSSDNNNADNGTPPVVTAPGDGLPPATATKAGTYVGDFGSGEGVYVISNENRLAGLAIAADGSANSLFQEIGAGNAYNGSVRTYYHGPSVPATAGVFGPGDPASEVPVATAPSEFDLNIVNGQTIESQSDGTVRLVGSGNGALTPATAAAIAGTWSGTHRFCEPCQLLTTEITFSNEAVSGHTVVINSEGTPGTEFPITGIITPFGDVSQVSFTWSENTYNGVVFFAPDGSGQLVFMGETQADVDRKTIASLLSK